MSSTDVVLVAMLGLVCVGLVYLGNEVQRMREQLEPIATSPLVRGLSNLGA